VLDLEVLVLELSAVNRLAASAVAAGEVSALAHEPRDDPVKPRALEVERLTPSALALLASAEATEILGALGCHVVVELEDDPSALLGADAHVEVHQNHCLSC